MKILQIVGEIDGGGVGAVVLNYLSHMTLTDIECDIIAFRLENKREQLLENSFKNLGCNVIYMNHRNTGYKKHFKEFRHILARGKYDAVHCHFGIWSAPYLVIAYACNIKIRIAHSHIANDEYDAIKQRCLNVMKPILNCVVTDKMACGNAAGKYLWGNHRFHIINNAIDTMKFQYNPTVRNNYRKKLNISDDCVVLGHIGRFSYQKNQQYLINLYEDMRPRCEKLKMIMIGNGEDYLSIANYIREKQLENDILLLGLRTDIAELLQAMDIFLLPSKYEGLPVVAIEAQCAGLPCLFSDQVTDEVLLLDKSIKLAIEPINKSLKIWEENIEKIVKEKSFRNRMFGYKTIQEAGYDIRIEAERLRQFYLSRRY